MRYQGDHPQGPRRTLGFSDEGAFWPPPGGLGSSAASPGPAGERGSAPSRNPGFILKPIAAYLVLGAIFAFLFKPETASEVGILVGDIIAPLIWIVPIAKLWCFFRKKRMRWNAIIGVSALFLLLLMPAELQRRPHTPKPMEELSTAQTQQRLDKAERLALERRLDEAERLSLKRLRLLLGPRHPDTLSGINRLAVLYQKQGRYGEAESLHREALRLYREVLGPRHPNTLTSMNNLAALCRVQGHLGEAERLSLEALRLQREVLGPRHPDTFTGINNLATLYREQGRLGEAEPLLDEALQLQREMLDPRHPDTLSGMSNLADLYVDQGRLGKAERLFLEALRVQRAILGPRDPATLTSMNNLAGLYQAQGRRDEAERLLFETLQLEREVLGSRHPATLTGMNNLAGLYLTQGRLDEAERLSPEVLQLQREVLGSRHPNTLTSMNTLAGLYQAQGRFSKAEPLLREALEGARQTFGPAHPQVMLLLGNGAANLVALGRVADAVRQLRIMEEAVLTWLGVELYTNRTPSTRGYLIDSQARYQDAALSLALLPEAGPDAAELAASAVLHLKGIQAEEEAHFARLSRSNRDSHVREIAAEIGGLRSRLAALFRAQGKQVEAEALYARLQEQEFALAQANREYGQQLQVRRSDPARLRAALPQHAALLELREYHSVDFRAVKTMTAPPRWAGILVTADRIRVVDLGPTAGTEDAVRTLLADIEGEAGRHAARALHDQLLGPLAAGLAGVDRLYVAPDGDLHLLPFAALIGPDGQRLAERFDLRLLQTGRDLLRPASDRSARGLLALGGIDFDADSPAQPGVAQTIGTAASAVIAAGTVLPVAGGVDAAELHARTAAFLGRGFPALPGTAVEARAVADLYRRARPGEPVELWEGAKASEAWLRAHAPPRALHLATHGFYRPADTPLDRPLLLSGVALAGANRALREPERDGILHAIEAQDLDLDGTELVVLSACDTAKGQIDYGEGVSGLVRALRTAGAQHVLVALRPVSDEGAADFVARFYRHWLSQTESDPAAAFRATQLEVMAAEPAVSPARRDQTWAQFILVGR